MVARGSAPRPYSRTSCRSAESRLCSSGRSTPYTLTPSLTPTTLASPTPSPPSSSYHAYSFPFPASGTNNNVAALSSPAIATTPTTPSSSSYFPSSPVYKPSGGGSGGGASHSHSYSLAQRPTTSLSMGFGIARPSSAASTRSNSSLGSRDEGMQQRIERLRASGWQRKRFDTRRYEALREQVLGELGD